MSPNKKETNNKILSKPNKFYLWLIKAIETARFIEQVIFSFKSFFKLSRGDFMPSHYKFVTQQ